MFRKIHQCCPKGARLRRDKYLIEERAARAAKPEEARAKMKTKRWMKAVIAAAETETTVLPWSRQARAERRSVPAELVKLLQSA